LQKSAIEISFLGAYYLGAVALFFAVSDRLKHEHRVVAAAAPTRARALAARVLAFVSLDIAYVSLDIA